MRRFLPALGLLFSLAVLSVTAGTGSEAGPFLLKFDDCGVVSLKRAGDAYDTEYIQPFQTLGHVLARYRMPGRDWQTFQSNDIPGERRRLQAAPAARGPQRRTTTYNESGWDDYFADLEVQSAFTIGEDGLYWTLHFRNLTHKPLEIGDLSVSLPFNSEARWDKDEMYKRRVVPHRLVSGHGSFVFWMRPNTEGPYLVMTPVQTCPLFEPNRNERNFRPPAFEFTDGRRLFLHSLASGEEAAAKGGTWRQAHTSLRLSPKYSPNDEITYVFKFQWADDYDGVREVLWKEGLFDVQVVPGMTVPADLEVLLSLRSRRAYDLTAEFPDSTRIEDLGEKAPDTHVFRVRFERLGENLLTVSFGERQSMILEFFVTEPLETLVRKRSAFLVARHQHRDPSKWYNGLFSEWDMEAKVLRGPDNRDGLRRYILNSDDPGLCKAPYIAAKNAAFPVAAEIEAVEYYIRNFVWGKLQRTDKEEYPYGVYGIPDWKANREAGPLDREGWTGHIWRTFDYPHVINLYWSMHRVAAAYPHLVGYLDADGYLERAFGTAQAYYLWPIALADWPAEDVGNYDEVVIPDLIDALERRGWTDKADWLRKRWEGKVERFVNERPNLFHSEFPYDPTGFESHHAFARYAVAHAGRAGSGLKVEPSGARSFMEEQIALNIGARGWLETAYYLLGGERNLRYMSQMAGWSVLDYALHHAADPFPYLRLGYASILSSWALMNSGPAESGYGFWFPGEENDGAAGSAFQPNAWARVWLGKDFRRGPWAYSAEMDLGFGGFLRAACTVLADDPLFGRIVYGGRLSGTPENPEVFPMDGLRQRFHAITADRRLHLRLDRDGFAPGKPIRPGRGLDRIAFTLENRSGDGHVTTLHLSGLPQGRYDVRCDGETVLEIDGDAEIPLPVPGKAEAEILIVPLKSQTASLPQPEHLNRR